MARCLGRQRAWMPQRNTRLPTVVSKNQPLVPRSNIAGSWARGAGGRVPHSFVGQSSPWTALILDSERSLECLLVSRLLQLAPLAQTLACPSMQRALNRCFQDFLGPLFFVVLFFVVLHAGLGICDVLAKGKRGSFMSVITHSVHKNMVSHIATPAVCFDGIFSHG